MEHSDLELLDSIFLNSKIFRLQSDFIIKPFSCDEGGDFDKFLFDDAKCHLKYLLHVTYVLQNESETIAYFTLANDNLRVNLSDNREVRSKLKKGKDNFTSVLLKRSAFPAVKIGILAVSKNYQRKGIGSVLLELLIYSFINNSNKTGCMFITVDAVQDAIDFYSKNNFHFLSENDMKNETRQMYRCLL